MQMTSGITDIAHSIQLAVAPVFLLTGVATMLTVLTNRLGRIIDRARFLELSLAEASATAGTEAEEELHVLARRARVVPP